MTVLQSFRRNEDLFAREWFLFEFISFFRRWMQSHERILLPGTDSTKFGATRKVLPRKLLLQLVSLYPFFTSLGFRPKFSGGRGLLLRSNRPLHPVRHQDQLLRRRQQPRHRQDRIRRQGRSNWNKREMKQYMASPFVSSGTDGCLPLNNSMYSMYTTLLERPFQEWNMQT